VNVVLSVEQSENVGDEESENLNVGNRVAQSALVNERRILSWRNLLLFDFRRYSANFGKFRGYSVILRGECEFKLRGDSCKGERVEEGTWKI